MALRNPVFNNSAFQQDPRAVQYPTQTMPPAAPGARTAAQQNTSLTPPTAGYTLNGQPVSDAAVQANLDGMYAAPSASAIDHGRMTVEDTVWKTAGLFGILIVAAVVGWVWTLAPLATTGKPNMVPMILGALVGFVLALVITFTGRKKVRPALIFAYAAFEGLFIGGISAFFETNFSGIVVQATLATIAVVGTTLALFASGKIRASAKATKIFMIAMVGYLVFSLLNVVLMWTNVLPAGSAFGLRSMEIAGIPLGLIIGIFVVIMGAYSLVLDFDGIQQGVRNGAPRQYGWMGAFGILVTVVWLYVEILRILAILRGND